MAWMYNPKTNRWENGGTPPTTTEKPWDPVRGNYGPQTTTTTAPSTTTTVPSTAAPTTTTTTVPKGKAGTTGKPSQKQQVTSNIPFRPSTKREPLDYDPKIAKINDPENWLNKAVSDALGSGDDALLRLLLSGGGESSGPSEAQLRQQRISAAQKMGRQTSAMARDYYGKQSNAANQAIDAATAELLANLGQPKAYSNVPLVTVPPALQGLQQNLLAYGATGQDAAAEAAQGQQTNDMYAALAKRSAEQLGAADQGYFDALRRAALGAQAAGRQGVAQNTADLQNQVLLANIQALLNASQ